MARTWDQFTSGFGVKPAIHTPIGAEGCPGTVDGEGLLAHSETWKIDFRDLNAFLRFIWGYTGTARGPRLSSPIFDGYVATGIDFVCVGAERTNSAARPYSHALVTVQFGTLPFGTDGSTAYMEVRWRGSSNLITVPNTNAKFAGNNEVIDFDSGLMVGAVAVETTFHQIGNWAASLATVMALTGRVNSAAITLDGFAFPVGTLLLPTFDAAKATNLLASPQQSMTVSLLYRQLPWNKGIRSDGTVDDVVKANGDPFYPPANFGTLATIS